MRRKLYVFLLISILFLGNIAAQTDSDFPLLATEDGAGIKIIRAEYYAGDALWGIINGGADLFLEYGFDKLLLQEIVWNGVNFRVEFYRMNDAEAAYGIFSVSHFKCSKRDTLTKYVCITPFQVQCALGRFYVSIANDKGNKEAEALTINLFEKVLAKSKEKLFEMPEGFSKPEFSSQIKNLKVIKGALGFQNGFPMWSEKFEHFSNYFVYLLAIESGSDYTYYSFIRFASNQDIQKFMAQNSLPLSVKTKVLSETELLLYESNHLEANKEKIFFE